MNGTRVDTEDIHHLQSCRENDEGAWTERGGGGGTGNECVSISIVTENIFCNETYCTRAYSKYMCIQ